MTWSFKMILAAACAVSAQGLAESIATFDDKPGIAVWQPEESSATIAFEEAVGANGQAARVSWKVPPKKFNLIVAWPDAARPKLQIGEAGGKFKFRVFTSTPKSIRRFEVRVKDARGESWTFGTDMDLAPDKWQEVTIILKKGLETARRGDKPGRDDGVLNSPLTLAHIAITLQRQAPAGSVLLDDVTFEPSAASETKPAN